MDEKIISLADYLPPANTTNKDTVFAKENAPRIIPLNKAFFKSCIEATNNEELSYLPQKKKHSLQTTSLEDFLDLSNKNEANVVDILLACKYINTAVNSDSLVLPCYMYCLSREDDNITFIIKCGTFGEIEYDLNDEDLKEPLHSICPFETLKRAGLVAVVHCAQYLANKTNSNEEMRVGLRTSLDPFSSAVDVAGYLTLEQARTLPQLASVPTYVFLKPALMKPPSY